MRLVRLLPCVLPLSLVGCGCGSWSVTVPGGAGAYTADLVEGAVTVVRPREEVEDVLLYDELTLAWDLVFDGPDGLSGSFRGQDDLRVVRP